MRHPDEQTLALHSSDDLGWFARWRTERHVAQCAQCRDEVASFRELREALPDMAELPEVQWNRIAGEMRANIRLGLAAGECVAEPAGLPPSPLFGKARAVVAFASMVTLIVTGLVLERVKPNPRPMFAAVPEVRATSDGIQMRSGDQGFELIHAGVEVTDVVHTVNAQGTMGASYVDPQTGYVTMTKVYAQ